MDNIFKYLAGNWAGKGKAEYPTIEPAEYIEELVINGNDEINIAVSYTQKSWLAIDGKKEKPLSWETGFIVRKTNGIYELANSNKDGRMELFSGNLAIINNLYCLEFFSKNIISDPRLIKTKRKFWFDETKLKYEVYMQTRKVNRLIKHLEADLTRL